MSAAVDELALPASEIKELTGYERPAYQMKVLKSLGIPARLRPDNSVLVLRMHLKTPVVLANNEGPRLKSSRK